MRIRVYKDGRPIGWIKSVSVYRCKFYITENYADAKHSYKSQDELMSEIDICTRFLPKGEQGRVVFSMEM